MNALLRVLLVEDVSTDAELEVRELRRAGLRIEHRVVKAEKSFREAVVEFIPDVILSDFSMPGFDGMLALSLSRELCPETPFIFVSGTIGEEYAIRALKNGATDYVLKTNLVRLPVAVERALKDARQDAEKRRIESALLESESGLRRAQLVAALSHVITGPDGSFENWSESLPRLVGVAPSHMPGSTRAWLDLVHPDDRALFRGTCIEAGRRATRMELEYRLQRHDGAMIHIRQVMEPLAGRADADGRWRWFNTLQDVTAQKQAATALLASEERYRATFEQAAVGIVHSSLDGQVLMVNQKFCELTGYPRAEAIQISIRDLTHPDDIDRSVEDRSKMLSDAGTPYQRELRLIRKDRSQFWANVTTSLVRTADGKPQHFVSVVHDISDRKRAEEDLRRFRLALDNSADMILIIDRATMRHVDVNQTVCKLLGYTRDELLRMEPKDILPVNQRELEKTYDELIANPSLPSGMTSYYRCKDGSQLPFESTRRVQRSGDTWLVVAISRDIRERLASDNALRDSEARFRSLTELSSDFYWETDTEHHVVRTEHGPGRHPVVDPGQIGKARWETPSVYPNAAAWAAHRATMDAHRSFRDFEVARRGQDGTVRYRSLSGEPVFDETGAFKGYRGVGKDVTEHRTQQNRIERLNRVYAVLSGINAAIVRVRDRDELFRETCRIAVEQGGFGIAQILLVDEDAYEIVPGPSAGVDALPVVKASFRPGAETISKQGTTIRALRERKPVYVNDITSEPVIGPLRTEALRRGYGSVISLPLMVHDRIVAVLLLNAKEKKFFDEQELRLLVELAGDVSFALDNLEKAERLKIETVERSRAEAKVARLSRVHAVLSGINATIVRVKTKEELYREACRVAVEAGGFRMAWIGTYDIKTRTVTPFTWEGHEEGFLRLISLALADPVREGRGLVRRAVRENRPVVINDIEADTAFRLRGEALARGYRAVTVLPLAVAGEIAGVLGLFSGDSGFFDEEEMKLLYDLAGDISFALDHIDKANKIDYLAYYDSLTGLANRTLFHDRLSQYVHTAQQAHGKLALVLADVERFKTINDSLGRHAGDELLKQLAARLGRAADPIDIARIGGDHFAIVLPGIKGRSEIGRTVEAIWRDCFALPFRVNETELRVSAKTGIALFPSDGGDAETLFANAEAALQKAQETGERHQFHSRELTARVAEQLALENQLRQALEKEEFVLHYQPKVDLETRRIVGVEALIRWQSPELGLVPPMKFIPLMEETGLILEVGTWALKRASLDHRRWTEQKLKPPRVAVNVSPIQLRQRDFVGVVEQAIIEGVAPTGIDLEITESLIMEDIQGNIEKLKSVRQLGVQIAIDDFGTGYSSLGYLAKLPVQTLKIDRSFIITMLNDADTMTLVSTIISLAHSLRLKVVAEGVDAEEQAKMLRLLRCDEMQGYLFSKPLPIDQMTALLEQGGKT